MVLHILVRRNYGGKLLISIKYHNLHSFKEWVILILLCQSILETRQISYFHALFTISLRWFGVYWFKVKRSLMFHSEESNKTFRLQNNMVEKLQYIQFSTTFKPIKRQKSYHLRLLCLDKAPNELRKKW